MTLLTGITKGIWPSKNSASINGTIGWPRVT